MAFDVKAARSAGYTDDEIAGYLADSSKFDLNAARSAGYTPSEIVDFLSNQASSPAPAQTVVQAANPPKTQQQEQDLSRPAGVLRRDITAPASQSAAAVPRPGREAVPDMSAGSVAQDALSGALQIGPVAVKGVADLARLTTGDRVGKDTSDYLERGMQSIRDTVGSERAAVQRRNFDRDMADPNVSIGQVLSENKGALADQILPTVGSMILPVGAAGLAGKAATAGRAAQVARAIDEGTVLARADAARRAAVVGTTVAQNAADTYTDIRDKGGDQASAYTGAAITAPFTAVAGKLTGGAAETQVARMLSGSATRELAEKGLMAIPAAAIREGAQEVGEEAGQYLGESVGTRTPLDANTAGKRLAVAGTLGAVVGGGVSGVDVTSSAIRQRQEQSLQAIGSASSVDEAIAAAADSVATPAVPSAPAQASVQSTSVDQAIAQAAADTATPTQPATTQQLIDRIRELEAAQEQSTPAQQSEPANATGDGPVAGDKVAASQPASFTPGSQADAVVPEQRTADVSTERVEPVREGVRAADPASNAQPSLTGVDPAVLLEVARDPTNPLQQSAASELRRRETDYVYQQRAETGAAQRQAEERALLDEAADQQIAQTSAVQGAADVAAPTAMQEAFANARPLRARRPAQTAAPSSERRGSDASSATVQQVAVSRAPAFTAKIESAGTLRITGDAQQIRQQLADFGVDKFIPARGGVVVAKSQAARAQTALSANSQSAPERLSFSAEETPTYSQKFSEDNRLSRLSPSGASWQRIRENNPALRGKGPEDTITIYRATIGDSIRPDDFVAVDKSTLRAELKNVRTRDGASAKIVQQDVRVGDLLMGNDASEFVYFPERNSQAGVRFSNDGTNTTASRANAELPVTGSQGAIAGFRAASADHAAASRQLADRPQLRIPGLSFRAVEPAPGNAGQEMNAARLVAKRLFRRDVVFVKFDGKPLFNGVVSTAIPGKVFINAESTKPHMAVLGHELLHEMRADNPRLYDSLSRSLDAIIRDDSKYSSDLAARYEALGLKLPKEWREELHADIVGDHFTDPQFWQDLAVEQPTLFQRVAQSIRQFLNRVLAKARPFGTDRFLSDVEAARQAVTSAMREFSQDQVRSVGNTTDGIAMSVSEPVERDESTGLPLNADGTVTVYHHTSKANADAIRKTGILKAAAEPDVYVTTHRETDTGYGDTAVPIRVDPSRLILDDEFPSGRMDFRLEVGRPGGSTRVKVGDNVSATQGDLQFSAADLSQSAEWQLPEMTRTDRFIYEAQDGRIDLKRTQEAIRAAGREIEERFDARTAETLYAGRVAYRAEQFLKADVKPLLQAMTLSKVGMDELADYLHARGAEERNAQIAKVNPELPDGGAGMNSKGVLMTNDAAREYLAAVPKEKRAVLDALAKRVDAITKGTRELLVDEGLEKREVVDAWEATYKNYVPMFRDEAESGSPAGSGGGGGFNVRGANSQRATGSTKQVTNILAHVLMQREAAITRAEKNRVGMALYGLALTNPNRDVWTTIRPGMQAAQITADLEAMGVDPAVAEMGMSGVPTVRGIDPVTNKVVDRPNPMYKNLPGAIILKVAGEDRVLMLNEKNERSLRMAQSLKNLDGLTNFDLAGSIVGRTTRWLAAVNTQFNPAFGLVNGIRDTFGGAINLTSTPLKGKSAKVLMDAYVHAGRGIAQSLLGNNSSEWAKLYEQFQEDGGQTGYREAFRTAEDRTKAIEKEMLQLSDSGRMTAMKAVTFIPRLLDGFNTTIENAVRLSAYKNALDSGMSRAAAAKLARELTVDFNRKGRLGREVGPLYAFFNASVQGSARTIEALKGPTGAKIIAGGLALGVAQAIMLAMAGYEEDEVPDFIKARAFIIPVQGKEKNYIAIPLPLGLHVLPNTGRVITDLALSGGKEAGKKSFNAVGEIAGAFSPLGGGNIFTADGALRTALPTIIDPVVEIGFNKNFAGGQISKEPRGESDVRPGFARVKESTQRSVTGQAYIGISKALNSVSGGTEYEAGLASPTPEQVQYIAQVAGGGLLREIEKSINLSGAAARGDKVPQSKIPVLGRLWGEVDNDAVDKSRYFESSKAILKAKAAERAAAKAGDADAVQKLYADRPELKAAYTQDQISRAIANLNRLAVSPANDPEQLRQLDEARLLQMRSLNKVIKTIEDSEGKDTPRKKLRRLVSKEPQESETP